MDNIAASRVSRPNNPINKERHTMAKATLNAKDCPEDFKYIKILLSPQPEIITIAKPGQFKGIIGCGLAGLTTAFELKKLGLDVTVPRYFKRPRKGNSMRE